MSGSQQQRAELLAPAGKTTAAGEGTKEATRIDGNEFLDVVLPISQPTSDPGLTCSGLDAGIEIDDIVFTDELRSSGKGGVEQQQGKKPVAPGEENVEGGGATGELPEEKSLNASEVVGNLPVTTIDAGEHGGSCTIPVTTTAGENEQTITIPRVALPPVQQAQDQEVPQARASEAPQAQTQQAPQDQPQQAEALVQQVGQQAQAQAQQAAQQAQAQQEAEAEVQQSQQAQRQTPVESQAGEAETSGASGAQLEGIGTDFDDQTPLRAPKKAPKSCVVNMASDDEQQRSNNELEIHQRSGSEQEKNSEPELEPEPAKGPARRGRRPGVRKVAENTSTGVGAPPPPTRSRRASPREQKQTPQVTFDISGQPFTEAQQVQLRAQILVYGAVIQGSLPDESLMGAAFVDVSQVQGLETFESHLSSSRSMWEKAWKASHERIQKALASSLPSSPSSRAAKAKVIKPGAPAAAATPLATTTTTASSDLTSGFPLSNSVFSMASATISSWNSARSRQLPLQPVYTGPWGGVPGFQPPPPAGTWPPFPSAVTAPPAPMIVDDERSKGTKRKREPTTPAAAPQHLANDISPATAGLIEESPSRRGGDVVVSPGKLERKTPGELAERLASAKQRAEEAASAAVGVVEQSQSVWNDVREKRRSEAISGKEAQLASSFAAVTAAASVTKAAAAAADVAYAAALHARALAGDLLRATLRPGGRDEAEDGSDPSVTHVDDRCKALVSGARAEMKRQAKAASFSLARAENLDAVVRAAELAAEAARQAGRVISIGDPSSVAFEALRVRKAPRNARLKAPARRTYEPPARGRGAQQEEEDEAAEEEEDVAMNIVTVEIVDGELEASEDKSLVVEDKHQEQQGYVRDEIVVGSHVEIAPDEEDLHGVWFSAKVVALDGDEATVVYDELMDDDGSGKLEEQIDITSRLEDVPRVRIAHPMTKEGGVRKKRRASLGNQIWITGDHVDVWIRDGWWEGIVQSVDENESLVTVYFPGDGDSEVTKSWNLRPTLVWQDDCWRFWRDLHPSKKPRFEDHGSSPESQKTGSLESSRSQKKPAKKRRFSDVIEKDQEARNQQQRQQQQQQNNRKNSKPMKAASPRGSVRRGGSSLPSWGSKAKKKLLNIPEATSDSKDGEVRKSSRMIHPTSKLLEGMETTTTPKIGAKKVGASA